MMREETGDSVGKDYMVDGQMSFIEKCLLK